MSNVTAANNALRSIQSLDFRMKALKEERDAHIAVLLDYAAGKTGKHTLTAGSFTVSENNVYNGDAMAAALSPGQVRRVSKAMLDKALVKRLYPAVYEAAKDQRGHKVSIG